MNRLCRLVYQILACSGEYIIVIVQWIWENHAHTHADTHAETNTLTHPNSFQNKSHHYTGMLILSICFLYSISHDHITFQRIQTRLLTYNHQMYFTPFNINRINMTAKFMNESSREEIMSSSFYYVCVYQISRQSTIYMSIAIHVYRVWMLAKQNIPVLRIRH